MIHPALAVLKHGKMLLKPFIAVLNVVLWHKEADACVVSLLTASTIIVCCF